MSFLTCFWLLPQNEHFSRSPLSPMRATLPPHVLPAPSGSSPNPNADVRRCGGHSFGGSGGGPSDRDGLERGQDLVDDAVVQSLFGGQVLVPLDISADLFGRLAGVGRQHLFHQRPNSQDLPGLNLDIGGLAVATFGSRLVDQDPAIRQREPLTLGAGRQ